MIHKDEEFKNISHLEFHTIIKPCTDNDLVSQNAYVYAGRQCTTKAHTINATNNVYHIKRDHLRISPSWECSRHQLASVLEASRPARLEQNC